MTTVFIVEDDPILARIFSQALASINYDPEIIPDGQKAMERLKVVVPDLLLLDLHIPYISGEEILSHMRADNRFARTRIILATADALLGQHLGEQANLVLLKPISITQLQQFANRLRTLEDTNS